MSNIKIGGGSTGARQKAGTDTRGARETQHGSQRRTHRQRVFDRMSADPVCRRRKPSNFLDQKHAFGSQYSLIFVKRKSSRLRAGWGILGAEGEWTILHDKLGGLFLCT